MEFVSANPTGPLTVGNARGAFVGDLLCRILEAGGQEVTREYYFNDSGAQIEHLGASVVAARRGEPVPEDGYKGAYVEDLAKAVPDDVWALASAPGADAPDIVGRWAATRVRAMIEASLVRLGVRFDVWKSEASLHDEGWVERAVDRLREAGHVYEQDGALWFRSTTFGDDKDRVIYRSDGRPTYFAADIGYVTEKFSRGFDHLVYIWGVDHHGTVARNQNAAEAMGYDPAHFQVMLIGWVRFVVDGVEVSMSKRAGTFVTLDDLLDAVGTDAARWFFASRATHVEIDFDIELAKKQSAENPVYYVQYAHARIASILRKASEAGLSPAADVDGLLAGDAEGALARAVIRFPEVLEDAVRAEETQGITAVRHGSRDAVPRVLPRRPRGGRRRARPLGPAPGPRARHQDDAGERAGAARDLRARVDVGVRRPARVSRRESRSRRACRPPSARGTSGIRAHARPRTATRRVRRRIEAFPATLAAGQGGGRVATGRCGLSTLARAGYCARPRTFATRPRTSSELPLTRTTRSGSGTRTAALRPEALSFATSGSSAAWNSAASAFVSHEVSSTTPLAPSGPSRSATRSPPQPAAASFEFEAPPSRSRISSCISPIVSWIGIVQPAPSLLARSAGKAHDHGLLGRRELLRVEDLLRGVRRAAKRLSIAAKPP